MTSYNISPFLVLLGLTCESRTHMKNLHIGLAKLFS
jgi:hypothetical protein